MVWEGLRGNPDPYPDVLFGALLNLESLPSASMQ